MHAILERFKTGMPVHASCIRRVRAHADQACMCADICIYTCTRAHDRVRVCTHTLLKMEIYHDRIDLPVDVSDETSIYIQLIPIYYI